MGCRSRGVGQYVASEAHNVAWGRSSKASAAKAVVTLQGSHSVADEMYATDLPRVQALLNAGFVIIGGDLAQTATQGTFGSDTARTRVGQLISYVQGASSPLKPTSGKVHLMGVSGGATAAINYARQNPANVASMYLMVPLLDLQDFHNNRCAPVAAGASFTQAEVEAAYGGAAAFTTAVATHSPVAVSDLASLAGIPIKIAYSSNDQYVTPSSVTAFVNAVNAAGGNAQAYSLGAVLHNPANVDPNDVVSFFSAHP